MKRFKVFWATLAACVMMIVGIALPTANAAEAQPAKNYTGWVNGNDLTKRRWYDSGVMAKSKEFYDPGSKAWYWADADGSIAHDKDVFQRSNGGKWVRYDHYGHMIKGEDCRYGGWYYFDPVTGAMAKGMRFVPSNGGKWVYYDWVTGKMAHGEQYVNYDAEHTGWYLFDSVTGAMFHGDTFVRSSGGKWVRYDRVTGKMVKGLHQQDGAWYYFDPVTGAMAHGNAWVPEWNKTVTFDQVTGKLVGQGSVSVSQQNALQTAKSYLSHMSFSRSGLIEQLEYEGFSTADSTWAVDNCGANWYEQAEKTARSYLSHMSFSRSGLIEQLEYEGFTHDQAVHGVNSVGL